MRSLFLKNDNPVYPAVRFVHIKDEANCKVYAIYDLDGNLYGWRKDYYAKGELCHREWKTVKGVKLRTVESDDEKKEEPVEEIDERPLCSLCGDRAEYCLGNKPLCFNCMDYWEFGYLEEIGKKKRKWKY